MSYIYDNRCLLKYYDHEIKNGHKDVKPQHDLLRKILDGEQASKGTPFFIPSTSVNNWGEDVWTERLVEGMKRSFPELGVTFSANMGLTFQTQFLPLLRLPFISQLLFLFRGVPDILIQ